MLLGTCFSWLCCSSYSHHCKIVHSCYSVSLGLVFAVVVGFIGIVTATSVVAVVVVVLLTKCTVDVKLTL
jgi:hypothetical protein